MSRGEANMMPEGGGEPDPYAQQAHPGAPETSGRPSADSIGGPSALHDFVRNNLHLIIFAVVIGYLVSTKLYAWFLNRRSLGAVGNATPEEKVQASLSAARERQLLASREAAKRDAELREARRIEEIKEKERRLKAAQEQAQQAGELAAQGGEGQRLGFSQQLPRLPSGNNYRPSSQWAGGNEGGSYRPTGFSRPRRGG